MQVMDAMQEHLARGQIFDVSLQRSGERLTIRSDAGQRGDYVVQLVRYTPSASVDIRRGENAGRTIEYANIVTDWTYIERWDGRRDLNLAVNVSGDDPIVVLVQQTGHGPIVGAAQLR